MEVSIPILTVVSLNVVNLQTIDFECLKKNYFLLFIRGKSD